jgi:ketosteroid isomerase-like protein
VLGSSTDQWQRAPVQQRNPSAIEDTFAVTGGLHPAAVARTSAQARTARNLVDRAAASFPWIQRVGIAVTVRLPTRIRTFLYRDAHRRVLMWFNRRDWELNTLAMDPDRFTVTSGDPQRWPLPGPRHTYHGIDGFLELQEAWMEVWGDLRLALDDVVDAGHGRLVVLFRQSGTAAASGVPLEEPLAMINEFAGGRLVRQTYWRDQEAALRSAGLDEPRR